MLTMSIRSILFRATYRLSTAGMVCGGETQKEEKGSKDTQHNHYNPDVTLTRLKTESGLYMHVDEEMRSKHSKPRCHILTLGPLSLTGGPQVEQRRALLQQRVRILHTDFVDVIHTELQLTCQLCDEDESEKIMQVKEVLMLASSVHLSDTKGLPTNENRLRIFLITYQPSSGPAVLQSQPSLTPSSPWHSLMLRNQSRTPTLTLDSSVQIIPALSCSCLWIKAKRLGLNIYP